jgi:hypothetical protein
VYVYEFVKILKKFEKKSEFQKKSKKIKIKIFKKIKKLNLLILGWRGTPRRPISVLSHEKCFFHFQSAKIGFFVKRLPKRELKAGHNILHK